MVMELMSRKIVFLISCWWWTENRSATIGGQRYGVAKTCKLISVRVLDSQGWVASYVQHFFDVEAGVPCRFCSNFGLWVSEMQNHIHNFNYHKIFMPVHLEAPHSTPNKPECCQSESWYSSIIIHRLGRNRGRRFDKLSICVCWQDIWSAHTRRLPRCRCSR